MASVYIKTEAGHAAIRDRSRSLPRQARTLLVLADGTRTGEQLLGMLQGATEADLTTLVEAGLIAEVVGGKAARSAPAAAPAAAGAPPGPAPEAAPAVAPAVPDTLPAGRDAELSYTELYDSLNALSKEQLGLFKGYRFALEIEKASGLEGLREVAVKLVEEVQKAKGDSAAQMVRRALGLKR